MGKLRQLCHWMTGQGKKIDVSEFVPESHPLRQWSDVLPWSKFVVAVEESLRIDILKSALAVRSRYRSGCCWPWSCSRQN